MKTLTQAYLDEDIGSDEVWYCIRTDPYYCSDCRTIVEFAHITINNGNQAIVISSTKDNDIFLGVAGSWMKAGKNPKIVEYDLDMGLSITIDDLARLLQL